jgi:hypothetical protein
MLTLASGVTWHLNAELRLFANYVFAHVAEAPSRAMRTSFSSASRSVSEARIVVQR